MATVRVVDVETTGVDPKEHRIIELAAYDLLDSGDIVFVGSHLVNPKRPIPPEASAVHHLTDADLADAPLIGEVWPLYFGTDAPAVLCAHNSAFEESYIPGKWACTFKAALRMWPDAPEHKNQTLRYWLGLDGQPGFDRSIANLAHRAGPDAYVTAWILRELLKSASIEDIIAWAKEPGVRPRITIGKKWKGAKWSEPDDSYLLWLRDGQHTLDADWRHGAKVELARRGVR